VFFGDASYSIYLVHFPALSLLAKEAKSLQLDAWIPTPMLFFAFAAGLVCGGMYRTNSRTSESSVEEPSCRSAQLQK
jgi:peptidoglycan/LPS O-acetylase OafA/YrhL